jgi:hypothetical protein
MRERDRISSSSQIPNARFGLVHKDARQSPVDYVVLPMKLFGLYQDGMQISV